MCVLSLVLAGIFTNSYLVFTCFNKREETIVKGKKLSCKLYFNPFDNGE